MSPEDQALNEAARLTCAWETTASQTEGEDDND